MISNIFKQLESDSSRNFKIGVFKSCADNELFRQVVFLALDPFTQFYIRKIPKYTPNTNPIGDNLDWALDQLSNFSSRRMTGNTAIDICNTFSRTLVPTMQK